MRIELDKVSKKYGSQWIYRGVSTVFESGGRYAITGANGSGKSTLLKVISGMVTPNEGRVLYTHNGATIPAEDIYKHISYSAPYLDLPEELTVAEMVAFHQQMRVLHGITAADLLAAIDIPPKEIRDCSSGMKQRVKLALAYYTKSDILLLDEPTANMDHHWRDWTNTLVKNDPQQRIVIICSNEEYEYQGAEVAVSL